MANFWNTFVTALYRGLPNGEDLAHFLIRLVQIIVVMSVSLVLARVIKNWATQLLGRSRISANVIALAGNGIFVLILLLGVSWLLGVFGASWTAVVASLSVVTVALSLSLQDVLKNLVAGVYLLLEQPFKIGDQVAVKGITGEVEGIDIRTTIIRTSDGLKVLVPNTIVFTEVVTNQSAYDTRKVSLQLQGVRAAFQDLNHLVNDALAPFDAIEHSPAPRVKIQALDNGQATVAVDYWQRGDAPLLPQVLDRLRAAFPEAKITILASGESPASPAA